MKFDGAWSPVSIFILTTSVCPRSESVFAKMSLFLCSSLVIVSEKRGLHDSSEVSREEDIFRTVCCTSEISCCIRGLIFPTTQPRRRETVLFVLLQIHTGYLLRCEEVIEFVIMTPGSSEMGDLSICEIS